MSATNAPAFDDATLTRPAPEAAARLARMQLETMLIAALPLLSSDEASIRGEALHGFRVALRRLRSSLRGWRAQLPDVPGAKQRKRLKKLSRSGGRVRDLELSIEALRQYQLRYPGVRSMLSQPLQELAEELAQAQHEFQMRLRRHLGKAAGKLQRALEQLPPGAHEPAAGALRRAIADYWSKLESSLDIEPAADDPGPPHRARIAAKRLRYLLEPLRQQYRGGDRAVRQLAALQDGLGKLHDSQFLCSVVEKAADTRPELKTVRPLLKQAARQALDRASTLLQPASRRRLARSIDSLLERLDAAV